MNKKGSLCLLLGSLLLCAAVLLTAFNLCDALRAGQDAAQTSARLQLQLAAAQDKTAPQDAAPDYLLAPGMEMPTVRIDGRDYIGSLSIPALDLSFPVISRWSYPALRSAPCRYTGSAYSGDMVIAAHNYTSHFGRIKTLQTGDSVIFTDFDGNVFSYTVAAKEVLPPVAVDEMTDSGWDLTLFTCTIGGGARVTVRCQAASS